MGFVSPGGMKRTILPLCTVLALLLVAVGGASAADAAGTTTAPLADESGDDAGICLVGADSPCNDGENATTNATHPTPHNDSSIVDDGTDGDDGSDDGRMRIPEDQDGDGEIDERFRGDRPAGTLIVTALSLLGLA